jgi:ribosomal protein L21E
MDSPFRVTDLKRRGKGVLVQLLVQPSLPKGFPEAVYHLHGECLGHMKNDYDVERRIRKFGGKLIDMHDDFVDMDKPKKIIEDTVEKVENE